jgi:hypothetical protein
MTVGITMSRKLPVVKPSAGTEPIPLLAGDQIEPTLVDIDLPDVYSMGISKVQGGWAVSMFRSRGMQIIDVEAISGPEPKAVAIERYKIAVVRHLIPTVLNG